MKRDIILKLSSWKKNPKKKPLILKGARQVGKTWSLLDFAKFEYENKGFNSHYLDFRTTKQIYNIFDETCNPKDIIRLLEFRLKTRIDIENDLVIFDEIQECPSAITSFKYFEQDMKTLDIVGAGSHLGLLKNEESFPVGKVDFLHMFPMTFLEFTEAIDQTAANELKQYELTHTLPAIIHTRLIELLTNYLFTGGLPEVVEQYKMLHERNMLEAISNCRKIQNNLIEGYRSDFTKYSGVLNAGHINYVFESIPNQISKAHDKEVPKYRFKDVIPRKKGFEHIRNPLEWLQNSRLCIKNKIAKKSNHPLSSYCDDNKFKVYLFDVGILNCMLNIPGEVILDQQIGPYKGFIVENFVAQELFALINKPLFCWQEGTSEIEFLIVHGKNIIPLEVKAASRSRRAKSLDAYIKRYSPTKAFKITAQNYGHNKQRGFSTIPLYCCSKLMQ